MQKCIDALKELFRDLDARVLDLETNLCSKIENCIRTNTGVIDAITDLINSLLPVAQTPFTCADVASCINNNADVRAALDARLSANSGLLNAWLNGANFLPGAGVRDKITNAKFSGLSDGTYSMQKIGGVYNLVANTVTTSGNAAGRLINYQGSIPNFSIGTDVPQTFNVAIPFEFNTLSGKIFFESRSNPSNTYSANYIYDRITNEFIVSDVSGNFGSASTTSQWCEHNITSFESASELRAQTEDGLYRWSNRVTINNISNTGFDVIFHKTMDVIRTPTQMYGDEKFFMTIDAK